MGEPTRPTVVYPGQAVHDRRSGRMDIGWRQDGTAATWRLSAGQRGVPGLLVGPGAETALTEMLAALSGHDVARWIIAPAGLPDDAAGDWVAGGVDQTRQMLTAALAVVESRDRQPSDAAIGLVAILDAPAVLADPVLAELVDRLVRTGPAAGMAPILLACDLDQFDRWADLREVAAAGNAAWVCDSALDSHAGMLAETLGTIARATAHRHLGHLATPLTPTQQREMALAVLAAYEAISTTARAAVADMARAAAAAGADYGDLGTAAGITRQGARRRWPDLAELTRAARTAAASSSPDA